MEDAPPSDAQREAYRWFLANDEELRPKLEDAIFKFYNRVKEIYRDALPPARVAKDVPELSEPGEVWRLLSDPLLRIPEQPKCGRTVQLRWNCTWDDEHGFNVRVQNGRVVGLQE